MAADLKFSNAAVNAGLDAILALLNGGSLRIYSGTPPTTADDALSGNTLLAQLTYGNPAFAAAVAGVASANAITQDSSNDATGTATFYRALSSGGAVIMQDSVGTSGEGLNLNSTAIQSGAITQVTSHQVTLPKT